MRASVTPNARAAWTNSKLAQLQRLGAQQPRQPGPAGDAENRAQRQQAHIGSGGGGFKQVGMGFDLHLHHQHGGGDQQHAGDRIQRGVEILDGIVDASAEITGGDAQGERERQHDQRGQLPISRPVRTDLSDTS
jgi:hypothetical protein